MDRLLKQKEVEELLGLAPSTIEQWRLRGRGPRWVRLGRAVRYRLSDLTEYMQGLPTFQCTTAADIAQEA